MLKKQTLKYISDPKLSQLQLLEEELVLKSNFISKQWTKRKYMLYLEIKLLSNVISKNKRVSFQIHIGVICQETRKLCGSTLIYLFARTDCAAMTCFDIAASIIYKRPAFFWKINNSRLHFRESKW